MPASQLLTRLAGRSDRFPGAVLLHGTSEAVLEEASRDLAARLLCSARSDGDPDHDRGGEPRWERGGEPRSESGREPHSVRGGEPHSVSCDTCRRAGLGLHPDVLTIAPEGVQIRVDRIREAIAFGAGRPYEAARRVVRISRAELLGPEAANALLKSLEEPGSRLHWILTTTNPESLLSTIRSRCLAVPLAAPSSAQRRAEFQAAGYSQEDAMDIALLHVDPEAAAEELEEARTFRRDTAEALRVGLVERRVAALTLLAESLAKSSPRALRVLIELLADAALLAGGVPVELVRHRAVAGPLGEISRTCGAPALEKAATSAADYPPDTRRGNRRLHLEKVLLELLAVSFQRETSRGNDLSG